MKYLIVGLGNIGTEYEHTRHNIGFDTLDAFAKASNVFFENNRYGSIARCRLKCHDLVLLKPSTFVNLSGQAVRYWLQKEHIAMENLLIVVDDIALPVGAIRLKTKGSDAGHNGLKNIQELLGTDNYSRLRFGVGNNFPRGGQIDFVLGTFPAEERAIVDEKIDVAVDAIKCFCLSGAQVTMNQYNNK